MRKRLSHAVFALVPPSLSPGAAFRSDQVFRKTCESSDAHQAGASREITPPQASAYTLALYPHAHSEVLTVTFQCSGV